MAIEQITEAIRSGMLHLGDRLPAERLLASQMEISRPTLREAIRILVEAGVLKVQRGPGGGTFVSSTILPPELRGAHATLRMSEVAGVLEARRLLEGRVAQLAALYATDSDFEMMQEVIDLLRTVGNDRHRLFELDRQFHLAIARATRNETVVELVRVLFNRLDFARDLIHTNQPEPDSTIEIHQRTLQAIMAGDAVAIETVMDQHLARLERAWEDETGRSRLRRIPDFLLSDAHHARD